jgi:hypothetical protein
VRNAHCLLSASSLHAHLERLPSSVPCYAGLPCSAAKHERSCSALKAPALSRRLF